MQYIALDFETTGVNCLKHHPLSVAAVYDDGVTPIDDLPRIYHKIPWEEITLQRIAAKINWDLLRENLDREHDAMDSFTNDFGKLFREWLNSLGLGGQWITIAGKNPSFDKGFLDQMNIGVRVRHRMIDPAILYIEPGDKVIPDLKTCLLRAGITGLKLHDALDDALAIVHLLRRKWNVR